MIIKKATYKTVTVKQKQAVTQDVYGCDECKCVIEESSCLSMTVFKKGDDIGGSKDIHLCSWECALEHIQKVKTNYFVNLPFMHFDETKSSKTSGQHLQKLLRKFNPKTK